MVRRLIDRLLLLIGIGCLTAFIIFTVHSLWYQRQLEESFDDLVRESQPEQLDSAIPGSPSVPSPSTPPKLKEGDLVGRLEIPRLDLSVMVLEGVASRTLRLGAGHIPGTPFPGTGSNAGIAAHRDSFFRALSKIQQNDRIRFQTPQKTYEYRVVSTEIVEPTDVAVLDATSAETLTLVTCYPFYYIGPAPKRFIVKATEEPEGSVRLN
jgi:sortase A